jgi:hypothetical protein
MESKGEINEYVCRSCREITHSINLSHGTTPFGVRCPKCLSSECTECLSSMYRLSRKPLVTHAFYRPKELTPEVREYVLSGCLLFDQLDEAIAKLLVNDPIMPDTSREMFDLHMKDMYG